MKSDKQLTLGTLIAQLKKLPDGTKVPYLSRLRGLADPKKKGLMHLHFEVAPGQIEAKTLLRHCEQILTGEYRNFRHSSQGASLKASEKALIWISVMDEDFGHKLIELHPSLRYVKAGYRPEQK